MREGGTPWFPQLKARSGVRVLGALPGPEARWDHWPQRSPEDPLSVEALPAPQARLVGGAPSWFSPVGDGGVCESAFAGMCGGVRSIARHSRLQVCVVNRRNLWNRKFLKYMSCRIPSTLR